MLYSNCIKDTDSYKNLKIKLQNTLLYENVILEFSTFEVYIRLSKNIISNENLIIQKILDKYLNTISTFYETLSNTDIINLKYFNFKILDMADITVFTDEKYWIDLITNCLNWEYKIKNNNLIGDFKDWDFSNLTDFMKSILVQIISKDKLIKKKYPILNYSITTDKENKN